MEHKRPLQSISDDELLRRLADLTQQSRRVESDLLAHIGEVDERRLYAREASPSMFAYCLEVLHLSEAEAYLRIAAARASREHPMLLARLADGRLHLTGIAKLAPHLTRENRDVLLKRATHRSKRQIEELIAEMEPRPDSLSMMRKLPEGKIAPTPAPPPGPERALALRPDRVDASPLSRYVPAAIRRAVHERDGNRCAYVDAQARRCSERDRLEFHHRHPFGLGGDHSPQNICLMCRTHNAYLAERDYGKPALTRARRSGRCDGAPIAAAAAQARAVQVEG